MFNGLKFQEIIQQSVFKTSKFPKKYIKYVFIIFIYSILPLAFSDKITHRDRDRQRRSLKEILKYLLESPLRVQ